MKFNKYHFFWITPFIIGSLILLQLRLFSLGKENNIVVRVRAKVAKYDQFQLYFLRDGQETYSEEYSIQRNILGMNGYQTISFYVPDSTALGKLRLDIGKNVDQRFVEIDEITFDNGKRIISVLPQEITPNVFIEKIIDTKFYAKTLDNRFDPYLEFSQASIDNFNKLRGGHSVNVPLTLVFSFLIILYLWFSPELIRINRYSHWFLVLGIIIFPCGGLLLRNLMLKKQLIITVDAIFKKDDVLQTFLQSSGSKSFTEQYSISKKVFGSDERQKINFVFNDTADVTKIRIDISQNASQLPIQVFQVSFERDRKLVLEGPDIFSVFMTNAFIERDEKSNTLTMLRLENSYSAYDPFMHSTDLDAYFADLKVPHKNIIHFLPFLISLLFTLVFIFYLIFNAPREFSPKRFFEYGLSFFFFLILLLPSIDEVFKFQVNRESTEKRALAEKPKFKLTEIDRYPKSYETYFNDNFGFRNLLIKLGGALKINIFKASPAPEKVTIGEDNWIFLSGESYGVAQDIKRSNLLTQEQLDKRVNAWITRRDSLNAKGIKYYKALWPDKHNVYKEYLPFSMRVQLKDTISKTDQMMLALKKSKSSLEIIDVRKELIEKLQTVQVYLKNDTHWNEYGAFVAYQKLLGKISRDFPSVLPVKSPEDFNITWSESTSGDLLNIMGIQTNDHFIDRVPSFTSLAKTEQITSMPSDSYPAESIYHRNLSSSNDLRVIIFRDSFTRSLVNFISPHFKEVLYIWTPYDKKIVDAYKPDIVLECFVERYFE